MTNLKATFIWLLLFIFASSTKAQDLNSNSVTIPGKCYRLSLQLPLAFQDTLPWLEGCGQSSECLEMESAEGNMQIKVETYCIHFYPFEERKPRNSRNYEAISPSYEAAGSSPPAAEKAKPEQAPPIDPNKGAEHQMIENTEIMLYWKIVEGRYKSYFQIDARGELDYGSYHFEGRCKVEDWEILMASFRTIKWEEVPQE